MPTDFCPHHAMLSKGVGLIVRPSQWSIVSNSSKPK